MQLAKLYKLRYERKREREREIDRQRERSTDKERERERTDLYCPEDVPEAGSLLTAVFLGPVFVGVGGKLLQSLAKTVNIFSFVVLYKKMSCPFNAKTVTVTQIDTI